MNVDSIPEFADLMVQSGLVTRNEINLLLDKFERHFVPTARYARSITSWLEFLVSSGTLTHWQAEKLRHGQWKGFIVDGFLLLDRLSTTEPSSVYLAAETATGELVELIFAEPLPSECLRDYQVRKFRTIPRSSASGGAQPASEN